MSNAEIIRRYRHCLKMAKLAKGLQLAYYVKQLQDMRNSFPAIVGKGSLK